LLDLITPPPLPPRAAALPPIHDGWGPRPKYSMAALNDACECIRNAPHGCQESVLNAEAYGIGRLIAGGLMNEEIAFGALVDAGQDMQNYNPRRPWTLNLVQRKVRRAFMQAENNPNVKALAG
jgi:hypothetical protein